MTSEDRAVGALLGLAVGDAVGTTLEFKRPGTFQPISDMVGGGPFRLPAGAWTDDTSMALCLAESIVDTGGMDLTDQLRRYVAWRRDGYLSSTGRCFDIGNTTSSQLSRFERTGEAMDPHPDPDAAANGSLMRLAPVPIRWHADLEEAAERSAESSRTTHAADRPVDACRLLGAMTASLIGGTPWDEAADPGFWQWGELHPEIEAIARGSWIDKEPPAIRGTGFCVDALEAAIWAVAGADDIREAVQRAANLGGDAGVRTFIDLTDADTTDGHLTPYEPRLAQAAEMRRLDLRRINLPIPDRGVIDDAGYDRIVATIDEHRARGGVYVHCWGGVGRTGTVIGCVLAAAGHDHRSIEQRLVELRAGTRKAHRGCPENRRQSAVIRARARR